MPEPAPSEAHHQPEERWRTLGKRAAKHGHQALSWMRHNSWFFGLAIALPLVYALIQIFDPARQASLSNFLYTRFDDSPTTRWQDLFLATWDWYAPVRNTFLALLAPAFLLWVDRRHRKDRGLVAPMATLALIALLHWLPGELVRHLPALNPSLIGAQASNVPQWIYIGLVFGGLLSLPALAWLLRRVSLLDRYLVKSFLAPLVLCVVAFLGIWLVIDFSDNVSDFSEGEAGPTIIFGYYLQQLPQILVQLIPVATLLAVLYTLSRMSRSNELTSMLGAGRGLIRILMPLFGAAFILSMFTLVLNFRLAPHAIAQQKAALEAIRDQETEGHHQRYSFTDRVYVDPATRRIWFMGRYPADYTPGESVRSVYLVQLDEHNRAQRAVYSDRAKWHQLDEDRNGHQTYWRFDRATVWEMEHNGRFVLQGYGKGGDAFFQFDWPENPYLLGTAGLRPSDASIPEIVTYLRSTGELSPEQQRGWLLTLNQLIASSFTCLVITLFAAPLGVTTSRRGVLGGVAASVFIFFGHLFLSNLFIALGHSGVLNPVLAAWAANLILGVLGLILLWFRHHNREIPSLRSLLRRRPPPPAPQADPVTV